MKKKFLLFFTIFFTFFSLIFGAVKYDIIISDNSSGKLNINTATQEKMLRAGVAEGYTEKIISFRNIKGGIENINELTRISGIGEKTCKKLEKFFVIENVPPLKELYINTADDKTLSYYGFDKKEIKQIRKFLEKNKKIENNIILKEIISKNKYEKYKNIIRYDIY